MRQSSVCGLLVLVLAGCGRTRTPTDLAELSRTLRSELPSQTQLLASYGTDNGACWFIRAPTPLALDPQDTAVRADRESIPAGVLAGLLAQHERVEEAAAAEQVTGELWSVETAGGALQIREFHASTGWYTLIEFSRSRGAPKS